MILAPEHETDSAIRSDSIGGRMVVAREVLGLSTAQLARRAGVLTETLQAWETDRLVPRTNQLVKIAGMLNVSPTWLLYERGEGPSDELDDTEITNMQESLSRLRGSLLTVCDGLERLEKRLETYESYGQN